MEPYRASWCIHLGLWGITTNCSWTPWTCSLRNLPLIGRFVVYLGHQTNEGILQAYRTKGKYSFVLFNWRTISHDTTFFEPMTSARSVQCYTNWAIKPPGSWSFCDHSLNIHSLRMMYYSRKWHRHTRKKEIRVLPSGVEPKTFRFISSDARKVLGSTPDGSTRISFFRICLCHFLE